MSRRAYGQYCGLARALDLIGERWALLIVRDLLVSARRYTDLRQGLPGIPTNVLSTRLKELEDTDVVRRRALPRPQGGVVYELTDYGRDLNHIVLALGRWGARTLGDPKPGEIVTADSLVMALRSTFQPDATHDLRANYELHIDGLILHATIDHGTLDTAPGPHPAAHLVIHTGPAIKALIARELTPADALTTGAITITGDPTLLNHFTQAFRI